MSLMFMLRMELDIWFTESVFTETQTKIENNNDYKEAIRFIAGESTCSKYGHLIDLVYGETFPEQWRRKIFAYYNGRGCLLIDDPTVTDKMINNYDFVLSEVILETCLKLWKEGKKMKWSKMVHLACNY